VGILACATLFFLAGKALGLGKRSANLPSNRALHCAMNGWVVLHETSSRLRVRVPALAEKGLNPAWLESWIETQPGVRDVRINEKAGSVVVAFDPCVADRAAVLRRLVAFSPAPRPDSCRRPGVAGNAAPMVTSAVVLVAAPILSPAHRRLLALANAAPILVNGADTLLRRGLKVEVLDALAVGLATLRGEVYTANITTFLLALGEFLEHQTQRKSDRLLRRLLRPAPAPAWVERSGTLTQVPSDAVRVDEIVIVGESIPVDGRVVEGVALINQSAVTGEDLPVFAGASGTAASRHCRQRRDERAHSDRNAERWFRNHDGARGQLHSVVSRASFRNATFGRNPGRQAGLANLGQRWADLSHL
jgi:hypothetical protein